MTVATASSRTERTIVVRAAVKLTPEQQRIMERCALSFWDFLPYWKFKNRETGEVLTFAKVWRGQADLAEAMMEHPWLFALKAGKLGFSELGCAFSGWVARFRQPNARVHLFSRGEAAAIDLLTWVKFGLEHLPEWMRLPVVEEEAGGNTSRSFKLYAGLDDQRVIVAYATGPNISIDQTCQHAQVDEFARMPFGEKAWHAIETTVSPDGGTCHLISRGNGPNFAARMWSAARAGLSKLFAFFAPYDARPGRGPEWYEREATTIGANAGLWQWAPKTWQEAIQGDASYVYPQFDNPPGRHVTPAHPCRLSECRRIGVGIDPGGGTPTAMGLWGERSSGRVHLYDEFYRPGAGTDELVVKLEEWRVQAKGVPMKIFVPSDEKLLGPTLQARGFSVEDAYREIIGGIQLVTERLNTNGLTIHDRCVNHIAEFEDYRHSTSTDRVTRVEYAGERPVKHHADAMDEMRYAVAGLATWNEEDDLEVPITLKSGRVIWGRR